MVKQRPVQLLEDMLDAADKIIIYTYELNFQDFMDNDQAMDAVVRNFEIMGEAAGRLPEDFKSHNNKIKWRKIIAFRNCMIHEYFQIDYEKVWKIKDRDLPPLVESIEQLIDDLYFQSDYSLL